LESQRRRIAQLNEAGRELLVHIVVVVLRQGDLFHVIAALRAAGRLPRRLDRGKQQGQQDGYDRKRHEQLNQREASFGLGHRSPSRFQCLGPIIPSVFRFEAKIARCEMFDTPDKAVASYRTLLRHGNRFPLRNDRSSGKLPCLGAHRKPKCFPALEKAPERAVVAEKLTRIPEKREFITMSFDASLFLFAAVVRICGGVLSVLHGLALLAPIALSRLPAC
jgi:hypothetical protein